MNEKTYNLNQLVSEYSVKPEELSDFIIDRLCAKLDLAREIYQAYDRDFKKPVSADLVPSPVMHDILKMMLAWNWMRRDWKVLNTLLKASEKYESSDILYLQKLAEHAENLCNG